MRGLLERIQAFLPKRPRFWIILWGVWFITLWFLSSRNTTTPHGPEIPHFDKIAHFGYFGLGAIFVTSWLRLKHPALTKLTLILVVTALGATVGGIDEYHQTFTPGRSGNDPYDWLADVCGSLCGALGTISLLLPYKSRPTEPLDQATASD